MEDLWTYGENGFLVLAPRGTNSGSVVYPANSYAHAPAGHTYFFKQNYMGYDQVIWIMAGEYKINAIETASRSSKMDSNLYLYLFK